MTGFCHHRTKFYTFPTICGEADFIEQNNIVICFFIKNRIPARVLQRIVDKAVCKRSMLENKFWSQNFYFWPFCKILFLHRNGEKNHQKQGMKFEDFWKIFFILIGLNLLAFINRFFSIRASKWALQLWRTKIPLRFSPILWSIRFFLFLLW